MTLDLYSDNGTQLATWQVCTDRECSGLHKDDVVHVDVALDAFATDPNECVGDAIARIQAEGE